MARITKKSVKSAWKVTRPIVEDIFMFLVLALFWVGISVASGGVLALIAAWLWPKAEINSVQYYVPGSIVVSMVVLLIGFLAWLVVPYIYEKLPDE